jgi:hypothetical protein
MSLAISCIMPFHFTIIANYLRFFTWLIYFGLAHPQTFLLKTCLGGMSYLPTISTLSWGSYFHSISFLLGYDCILFFKSRFCYFIKIFIIPATDYSLGARGSVVG